MTIKAIQTQYKGYHFRSRLEARYAVLFDSLGFKWEYEKEGYDLGECGYYLPDFFLPDLNVWIEIKGGKATDDELYKCSALSYELTGGENITDLFMLGDKEITSGLVNGIIETTKRLGLEKDYTLKESLIEAMELNASRVHVFLFEGMLDDGYMCVKDMHIQARPISVMYHLIGYSLFHVITSPDSSKKRIDRMRMLDDAIQKARSARFEYGQSGSTL